MAHSFGMGKVTRQCYLSAARLSRDEFPIDSAGAEVLLLNHRNNKTRSANRCGFAVSQGWELLLGGGTQRVPGDQRRVLGVPVVGLLVGVADAQ